MARSLIDKFRFEDNIDRDFVASMLMRRFIELNIDLIVDEKLKFESEDSDLKCALNKLLNEKKKKIEGASSIQEDLFKFIGKHKGATFIDEHNALFEPIKIPNKKSYKNADIEEYFKDFASWTQSSGVSVINYFFSFFSIIKKYIPNLPHSFLYQCFVDHFIHSLPPRSKTDSKVW